MEAALSAAELKKKEKEAKKKAEKEAKLKKFQEKQQQQKIPGVPGEKPKEKEKPVKEKPDKVNISQLIEQLDKVPQGTKKPLDTMPDAYDPKFVEALWYPWWVNQGYFKPEYGITSGSLKEAIAKRGKFVMVIPPPNVTGTLHLGHALMCTVEDVLTRWNRMRGRVTLWVPGCDHAGIATQMVVEKTIMRREGKSRHDLGREEFVRRVWNWKGEKGGRIYEQLKAMGISADWDREAFTMDDKLSRAVGRAFCNLFDWGFIYRDNRLVNWSCTLKSAISDIEVDKREIGGRTLISVPGYGEEDKVEFGVIWSFAYKFAQEPEVEGQENLEEIVVATTRPETMLGDVAVAVSKGDPRYEKMVGRKLQHPFVERSLVILEDTMVDKEFGTGAVKITPSHDQNDYECGKRHGLEGIQVIDENGRMMENCGEFKGLPRFLCRTKVIQRLKELGLYRGEKDNPMVVPICSRSKDIVEPLPKPQWYVKCDKMAQEALEAVDQGQIKIVPDQHRRIWQHWMENIRDWCISRQLWWGHQIPAYRVITELEPEKEKWVAAESEQEARNKAEVKFGGLKITRLIRDEDVLDTWFSSGLFPFSVFGWPEEEQPEVEPEVDSDLHNFYPTTLLETGHDIIFFWVSRMIFMAGTLTKQVPFKEVFLHSMVRDAHGRKMSKSLGNVIDPLDVVKGISLEELNRQLEQGNLDPKEVEKAKQGQKQDYPQGIPECGTDALRFSLCACMTPGGKDINLDVLRCQGYRFFCNKIWNAVRFAMGYLALGGYTPGQSSPVKSGRKPEVYGRMDRWILGKLSKASKIVNEAVEQYNFQDSTAAVYNFWLYEFCDVYLESLKPKFADIKPGDTSAILTPSQQLSLDTLLHCAESGLRVLHPFMPYLTEELWQRLPKFGSTTCPSIVVSPFPLPKDLRSFEDPQLESEIQFIQHFIKTIRSARAAYELPNKVKSDVFVLITDDKPLEQVISEETVTLQALSYSKSITLVGSADQVPQGCVTCVVNDKCTAYLLLKGLINLDKEEERINKKVGFNQQQITKLKEAMSKADYNDKVPVEVQEKNQDKLKALEGELDELAKALQGVTLMKTQQE